MELIDLLDKQQKTSFRCMQILINTQFNTTIEQLLQDISVSLPTIQKELQQLKQDLLSYDVEASLSINEQGQVRLALPVAFSLQDFFYEYYYSKATNLLLIESFYFQKEVSIAKLTFEFKLSEASLFRRLKQINQLFAEFNLKYKNNRLSGNAFSYQFFYFEFFSAIYPVELLKKRFDRLNFYHLINVIETNLGCQFNSLQAIHFVVWLTIAEKKLSDHLLNSTQPPMKKRQFIDDPNFKEIEQIFMRFSSRFAVQWPQSEIISCYHFLLSEGILSYSFIQSDEVDYLLQINELTQKITHALAEEVGELQQIIYPTLFRAHCQLNFFHHLMTSDFATPDLLSDLNPKLMERCMVLVEERMNFAITTNQWQKLDSIYGRVFQLVQNKKRDQYKEWTIYLQITDELLIHETREMIRQIEQSFSGIVFHVLADKDQADFVIYDQTQQVSKRLAASYKLQNDYWTPYERQRFSKFLKSLLSEEGMK